MSPSYSTGNRMTSSVPFALHLLGSQAWGFTDRKCWYGPSFLLACASRMPFRNLPPWQPLKHASAEAELPSGFTHVARAAGLMPMARASHALANRTRPRHPPAGPPGPTGRPGGA
jgi:hypothetical protein